MRPAGKRVMRPTLCQMHRGGIYQSDGRGDLFAAVARGWPGSGADELIPRRGADSWPAPLDGHAGGA